MLISRPGSKQRIAAQIIKHFPPHNYFIELFFGAGGLYFSKPPARFNFLNDIDSNIINLYHILTDDHRRAAFIEGVNLIPIDQNLFNWLKTRPHTDDPVKKAIYFWYMSNMGFLGSHNTIKIDNRWPKKYILDDIERILKNLNQTNARFLNCDFRQVISQISFNSLPKSEALIYSDPPYFQTRNKYRQGRWGKRALLDLFAVTFDNGIKGAMSEFNHPFVMDTARERGLNIIQIGERCNLKNRASEILITNYEAQSKDLFNS